MLWESVALGKGQGEAAKQAHWIFSRDASQIGPKLSRLGWLRKQLKAREKPNFPHIENRYKEVANYVNVLCLWDFLSASSCFNHVDVQNL